MNNDALGRGADIGRDGRAAIATKPPTDPAKPSETKESPFRTKEQLAELLQVDVRTIENWMGLRRIPYVKIGKTVRFRLADVLQHLDQNCTVHPRKPRP